MREEYWGPNDRWVDIPIQVRKYIDVFSAIEKLPKFRCNRHLSTARPKLLAHAEKSESLFDGMNVGSGEKGMRINKKKTQMLLISNSLSTVETFIRAAGTTISSSDTGELKILEFVFGPRPSVEYQVR